MSPTKQRTLNPATGKPTEQPSAKQVTASPSMQPTMSPTKQPTLSPSKSPTTKPSLTPTGEPTTLTPSETPTSKPTNIPTNMPTTLRPSGTPTTKPSYTPTLTPSNSPTAKPTRTPTFKPTTLTPSNSPTVKPTDDPTSKPTLPENPILSSQTKLLANDGSKNDNFGNVVAASGDTVVVGAYRDDDNGGSSGSAYVFIRDGDNWTQQAKLLPNDGAKFDLFGSALSVSGDTIVVGAYRDDDNDSHQSGSAYVFIRNGDEWIQQAKLLPNDGAADDHFGISVSLSGDTVVVGACYEYDNGINSGSAYVFIRNGDIWTQQAKLLPNDGAAGDWFGSAVAASGDTVVVGARYDEDNGFRSGSAYVFIQEGGAWTQQAKLLPNDGAEYGVFGSALSVNGNTVVVGASNDDDNGIGRGSAYVYIRDGNQWTLQAKLLPNDGAAGDYFGKSVTVSGDTVVVGAIGDDDNADNSGSAYLFIRNGGTWTQQAKLLPNDGAGGDRFGWSVAVSGDTVVVGADLDDDNGNESGSAYVFSLQ